MLLRPLTRLVTALQLAIVSLLLVCAAPAAFADVARTLVVRGRVLRADGTALAGARVLARGTANVSALSDDRGRYSLSVAMGTAASLKRGAFTIEVRAESDGKRLAYAAGGPALGIEVAFVPGTSKLRVRSNAPGATAAVITAFAQEGVPTAWVDADFGGAAPASGSVELRASDEVTLAGIAPASGTPPREKPAEKKLEPRREEPAPAPTVRTPAPMPAPSVSAPAPRTVGERHVRDSLAAHARDSVAAARRMSSDARARLARAADSTARAEAAQRRMLQAAAETARRDSLTRVKAARHRADSLLALESRRAPAPAGSAPESVAACRATVRGTVEVAWERPLEENLPVTLSLAGVPDAEQQVEIYLGAPREFRFGPLPCGDYDLRVQADGRYRYTLARGDTVMRVHLRGNTQVRVVLHAIKR